RGTDLSATLFLHVPTCRHEHAASAGGAGSGACKRATGEKRHFSERGRLGWPHTSCARAVSDRPSFTRNRWKMITSRPNDDEEHHRREEKVTLENSIKTNRRAVLVVNARSRRGARYYS